MKPIIELLGDEYKAAKFIRFAERKLNELKVQMERLSIDMQNRLYRFTTDNIEVYIESYKGFDKVRIRAGKVVGCRNDYEQVDIADPVPFQTGFINSHWLNGRKVQSDPSIAFWYIFDDGTAGSGSDVGGIRSHIFPSAGDYNITLYSFLAGFDTVFATVVHTPGKTTMTVDTLGKTKMFGHLSFFTVQLTVSQITVTVDGVPITVLTDPETPNRDISTPFPSATGDIMVAELTYPLIAGTPASFFNFAEYRCLATKTKTITVT